MNKNELASILRKGVPYWNKWRNENPDVSIKLKYAYFAGADFSNINFSNIDLTVADLFQ